MGISNNTANSLCPTVGRGGGGPIAIGWVDCVRSPNILQFIFHVLCVVRGVGCAMCGYMRYGMCNSTRGEGGSHSRRICENPVNTLRGGGKGSIRSHRLNLTTCLVFALSFCMAIDNVVLPCSLANQLR